MKKNLDQWLSFLESNHPTEIDMGLDRVREVAQRLELLHPTKHVLLVAGTNGKGSTVTMCSHILQSAGYSVGSYISPHLHIYNERVRINSEPVSDDIIIDSFEAVDQARGNISLTYFEVGTLSALYIFKQHNLDVSVLEIGLGGRLDAVNIVNADGAAVTSIGMDHQDWLGDDISQIALEKAGVYRTAKPAVCGERKPPQTLLDYANSIGAEVAVKGRDFDFLLKEHTWDWNGLAVDGQPLRLDDLPIPSLPIENASTAVQLIVKSFPSVSLLQIKSGLKNAQLDGRLQRFDFPFNGVMDVGHNPQAAELLNDYLMAHPVEGKRYAVFAMLKDKDAEAVVACIDQVNHWCLAGLSGYRGQSADELKRRVGALMPEASCYSSVPEALDDLTSKMNKDDEVVVFGSFLTVADAQAWLASQS